jgi:hypothetical protein
MEEAQKKNKKGECEERRAGAEGDHQLVASV